MANASGVFSGRSRYTGVLDVSENSYSIPGNSSSVHVDLRINETTENGSYSLSTPVTWSWNVDGQTASGSNTYDFRNYNVLVVWAGDITIGHNADGSKSIGFSFSFGGTSVIGGASGSNSMGLTTIPRASNSSFSPSPVDCGATVTINTNRASSGFTHTITYDIGSASGTIGTGIGASTTWVPPLSLMDQFPNAAQANVTITTYTYNGASLIGTSTANMLVSAPSTVVPDFTTITNSETVTAVSTGVGAYVQSLSQLALAITGAVGAYSSTITAYKIEILSGASVLQTISASSGTSAAIPASGTVTLRGTVTDSRGRTKQKTVSITVLAYAPPVLNTISVQRALSGGTPDDNGTYLRTNINASVSSLINSTQKNALKYRISVRNRGTTTWTQKANVTPGGIAFSGSNTVGTYVVTQAYEVLVEVYDLFTTSAIIISVPVASIFMHWDAGLGIGVGKYREDGIGDFYGDVYAKANVPRGMLGAFYPDPTGPGIVTDRVLGAGTTTQRDAYYGSPSTAAQQAALANRKVVFFNTDQNWFESYYAVTGTSGLTVTGLVTGTASGWYPLSGPYAAVANSAQQAFSTGVRATFTQWSAFGSGPSYRTNSLFTLASGKVTTSLAGRYRIWCRMDYPAGSGTGVIELGSKDSANSSLSFLQAGIPLLGGFGQVFTHEIEEVAIPANGYIYYDSVSASWTIASGTFGLTMMGLNYLGPALVSA